MPFPRRTLPTLLLALCTLPAPATAIAQSTKPTIWDDRDVTLTDDDKTTPVNVAIWDTGSDLTQFRGKVYTDPSSGGIRSDQHDLAYDSQFKLAHGYLLPLTDAQKQQYPSMVPFIKAYADLQLSLPTSDAAALKQKLASLSPADSAAYQEQLRFFTLYTHGTPVADVASRGNSAILLGVARITYDWRTTPLAPTEDIARRIAAAHHSFADWFDANSMRVVNISWSRSPQDYDTALEKNAANPQLASLFTTPEERKALAKKLFTFERDGLYDAIKNSPTILFICSADLNTGAIPESFSLPNLLTVAAVDQAGDDAPFTSHADYVQVDANGFPPDSVLPLGYKARLSGPALAAPAVTNLAAKLLALNPDLTPAQVIKLILDGATPTPDGHRHNINPRRSVDLLKAMTPTTSGKKKK